MIEAREEIARRRFILADSIVVTFDHGDYTFGGISHKLLHLAQDISVIVVD
jgi:hypothetical protein